MVSKKEKLRLREEAERVEARKEMEDHVKRINTGVSNLLEIPDERGNNKTNKNHKNNNKNNNDSKTNVRD
jgi:hypothetical protein